MNIATKDVVDYIDEQSSSFTKGMNLFYGNIPQNVESAVGLKSIPGPEVDRTFDGTELDRSEMQLVSRDNSADTGVSNLDAILTILKASGKVTINGTTYLGFWQSSTVFDLGRDENDRHVHSVHVRTIRS